MTTEPPLWHPPPTEPPRKSWPARHKIATAGLAVLGLFAIVTAIGLAAGSTGSTHSPAAQPVAGGGSAGPVATYSAPAPAPSPTLVPPNRVAFIITGNVPAGQYNQVDITYGSDSDQHNVTLPSIGGKLKYVVPFSGSASYYSVDVLFTTSGNVRCKIVVLGPSPDAPLTVSHGSASSQGGSGGDCSAQAAPNDSTGMSWQNEQ